MTPSNGNTNGWDQWQQHVLRELERLQGWMESMAKDQRRLCVEVAMLKVKAGIWGVMGGAIPVAILLVIQAWKQ